MRQDVGRKDDQLVEGLRSYLGKMAELATDLAHARKVQFEAYISEGFTEEQALRLICVPLFGNGIA